MLEIFITEFYYSTREAPYEDDTIDFYRIEHSI